MQALSASVWQTTDCPLICLTFYGIACMLFVMPASPTLPDATNSVQITIRITKTQHAVLQAIARHEGRTVSAEVRRLVEGFEREHAAHEHVPERGRGYTACMACGEMPDHPIHRVDLWPVVELTEHKERA